MVGNVTKKMSNQQELTPFPTQKWNSEQTVSDALLHRSALGNLIYNVQNRGLGYDMAIKVHVLANIFWCKRSHKHISTFAVAGTPLQYTVRTNLTLPKYRMHHALNRVILEWGESKPARYE